MEKHDRKMVEQAVLLARGIAGIEHAINTYTEKALLAEAVAEETRNVIAAFILRKQELQDRLDALEAEVVKAAAADASTPEPPTEK